MTFGQRLAYEIKTAVEIRKYRGASISWSDVSVEIAAIADKMLSQPINLPMCPHCSQPKRDERFPQFFYAHRTAKNLGSPRWIVVGCRHMTSLCTPGAISDEQLDAFEADWRAAVPKIFNDNTVRYTDSQRAVRWEALQYAGSPPPQEANTAQP